MVSGTDVYQLAMKGSQLEAKDATELEAKLKDSPKDIDTRTKLLGYYFTGQYTNKNSAKSRQQHVLWLIKNAPESEVLNTPYGGLDHIRSPKAFEKAKELWLEHLELKPKNLTILANTSSFFGRSDPGKSIELLERAQEIAPKDPAWPGKLGQQYSWKMIGLSGAKKREAASKSLKHFERAYELSDKEGRDAILTSLGKVAFAAQEMEKAKKYANQMLESDGPTADWNYGNKVHDGNNLLGRIALANGDVEEAKKRLLAAADTPGSPQLDSFGPNMQLASELLDAGEKQAVLDCFDRCEKFWDMGADRLKAWRKKVEKGRKPDFGANLRY